MLIEYREMSGRNAYQVEIQMQFVAWVQNRRYRVTYNLQYKQLQSKTASVTLTSHSCPLLTVYIDNEYSLSERYNSQL